MLKSRPAEASDLELEPLVARYADVTMVSSSGASQHPPNHGSQDLVDTARSAFEARSLEKTVEDRIEGENVPAYAEKQRGFEASHRRNKGKARARPMEDEDEDAEDLQNTLTLSLHETESANSSGYR